MSDYKGYVPEQKMGPMQEVDELAELVARDLQFIEDRIARKGIGATLTAATTLDGEHVASAVPLTL